MTRASWIGMLGVAALLTGGGSSALAATTVGKEAGQISDRMVKLRDLAGKEQQPFVLAQARAAVLIFTLHDCPVANAYAPELRRLRAAYAPAGVTFLLVHTDPEANPETLRQHQREYQLEPLTVVHDSRHKLVAATGATMTPEAVVITPDARIAYRGRIDNLYADYGRRRRETTAHELRDALDAILASRPVKVSRTPVIGCFIPKPSKP